MKAEVFRRKFRCVPESLPSARGFLREVLGGEVAADRLSSITIAMGEVWQNIIRHAARGGNPDYEFSVAVMVGDVEIGILTRDNAPPNDPAEWDWAERPPEEGGLGMQIIESIAVKASYAAEADGNSSELFFARVIN